MKDKFKTAVFCLSAREKYLACWEYYRKGHGKIKTTFDKVILVSSIIHFLKVVISKNLTLVYFWRWHRSILIAFFRVCF